ncbi:anti-sigma factor RsiW [Pseudorhizobium tarimense]|uniref:Anti-sigma factor RsiW n=1 Tax=Pseudorhizobium tarimense TaxID=1079109 RepID=A0ABV2H6U0_9HYPH|nr:anti-sigma factor [Pseudorhizobium tarimense]MCJ8519394.1 anti-sigma factor [Pseudorhizobium tarimense]
MAGTNHKLDMRLSMLLDREMPPEEQQELEGLLKEDAQARAAHDILGHGNSRGREIFDDLLKEPVPLDLVRIIKTAPPPRKAVRLPAEERSSLSFRPSPMQAVLGGVLLLALGGGLGFMAGQQVSMPSQALVIESGDWLDDLVAHYRMFSRQPGHLVEMPATDSAAIVEWLLGNTGINFRIPDLSENGLTFEGARLFTAGGQPVGELIYTSAEGEVISILFRKNRPDDDGFSELIRDNIALISWKSATATYVAVGPSSAASLDEVAAKAAGLI